MSDNVDLTMVCTCDEAGRALAQRNRSEVIRRLGSSVDDSNLVSAILYSLDGDHGASITGIHLDPWAQIDTQTKDGLVVRVQCDLIEDGLVALWLAYERRKTDPTNWVTAA